MADLGHRVFLMAPLRWRGPFARTCREWNEIAAACWQAPATPCHPVTLPPCHADLEPLPYPATPGCPCHPATPCLPVCDPGCPHSAPRLPTHVPIRQADDFELAAVQQSVCLARLDSPVTQLSAWVRS